MSLMLNQQEEKTFETVLEMKNNQGSMEASLIRIFHCQVAFLSVIRQVVRNWALFFKDDGKCELLRASDQRGEGPIRCPCSD